MADPKYVKDFIQQMTPYAVAVGDQYGIDPITIITQAAIETGWGQEVAGNNYFGIKSHGRPGGQVINTTEEINGKKVGVRDSFRTYPDMAQSVADYGSFLSSNPRYADALKQQGYKNQLAGIVGAGYATDSTYQSLVNGVSGMVNRNIAPLPPGSIPTVATMLDLTPPRVAPIPASAEQRITARNRVPYIPSPATPSQGVQAVRNGMFAQPATNTSRPVGLGDSLGMSPIQGGSQRPPLFNAGYDERTGAMRLVNTPMDTQGMWTARSPAPAPIPASVEDRVTARNRVPSIMRPPVAQPTIGQPPTTRVVPSVPMRPSVSAQSNIAQQGNDQAMLRARPPTPAYQSVAGFSGGSPAPFSTVRPPLIPGANTSVALKDEARLPPNAPGVGGITTPLIPYPASNRPTLNRPVVLTAAGGPPIPMPANMRPTAVGTALSVTPPRVAPVPFARPDFGMGGPVLQNPRVQGFAPVPRTRPLALQAPVTRPPLSILVDGSNTIRRPPQFTGGTSSILSLAGGAEDRGYGAYSR